MRVSKWGNSLAVRIPAEVVQQLNLKEGDDVEFTRRADGLVDVDRQVTADDVVAAMQKFRDRVPADFKFDRDEANAR